jgi:hypothetical protein
VRRAGEQAAVSRGGCEGIRWRGACAAGFVTLPPGRLRDSALPVLRPVCEELADGRTPFSPDSQARPGDRKASFR